MRIITNNAFYEQNIQKSRFLAFSYYVDNEKDAIAIIKDIENKYCDCRHVVYAYKIEPNIEKKGNSSEPAGTAGAPIFSSIEKNDLTNVLIVVVRYFGGILLGAQNLYRAYLTSATGVLELSKIKELQQYNVCQVFCEYSDYSKLKDLEEKYGKIHIISADFKDKIYIRIAYKDDGLYKELQNLIEKQNPKVEQIWL